jgi:hypothetical protein
MKRATLKQKFLFSLDVIVILRFWAWNNPLHSPEKFSQALYGNFAKAQGGNLFRSREGTITEFPGNFRNVRRKSRKFPGRAQEEICWDPPSPPNPLSHFIILVMLMCPRFFNFTLYNNTELTLQNWCNTMLFIVYNLWPNKYVYLTVE